jgi:hypothetical protein
MGLVSSASAPPSRAFRLVSGSPAVRRDHDDVRSCCLGFLTPLRERPPVSKPQKVVDLALSPAMILGRKRIDTSVDADVANKELRALDKVCYLINVSPAETTCGIRHRRPPSLSSQSQLGVRDQIRKWPSSFWAVVTLLEHRNKCLLDQSRTISSPTSLTQSARSGHSACRSGSTPTRRPGRHSAGLPD